MSMNSINISLPGQTFTNTVNFTTSTTWTVPYNVTQLDVRVWAAGGGGNVDTRYGGGGGFIGGYLSVAPNETLTIDIGAGGQARNLTEDCNLPRGKIHAGQGGGGSRIYRNIDGYFIAGAGGGAGEGAHGGAGGGIIASGGGVGGSSGNPVSGSWGGAPGCTSCHDEDPTAGTNAGFSGSIASGGSAGLNNACPDGEDPPNYQSSTLEQGSGGSGYAGGGGGGVGGGGGGASSGFEGGFLVSNLTGSGYFAANLNDPSYPGSNTGYGGAYGNGNAGYISIKY